MDHIEKRNLCAKIADATQEGHYKRISKARGKVVACFPTPNIEGKQIEVRCFTSTKQIGDDFTILEKRYGFDWTHVFEIFIKHLDESLIQNEIDRLHNKGYVTCFKHLVSGHKNAIACYKRCLVKIKEVAPIHAFGSDIQIERIIKRIEEELEWATTRCSGSKSIVKMLTAQAKEMHGYIRKLEKTYYKDRDPDKIPDNRIHAVIADLLDSFYRSLGYFYPFVDLSRESGKETILGRQKLTGIHVKVFLDKIDQRLPKDN